MTELSWTDAWIFASLGTFAPGARHTTLAVLIARADALNHAIPTAREIAGALSTLHDRGLVSARATAIALTPLGRRAHADGLRRRGGQFAIVDNMLAALRALKVSRLRRSPPARRRPRGVRPRFWFVTPKAVAQAYQDYTKALSRTAGQPAARCQVVIQLPGDFFPTNEALVAFEDRLIACMPRTCQVDGHDIGAGTINFFVLTSAPEAAHRTFRKHLGTNAVEKRVRIAYRPEAGGAFTNLWPRRDPRPFKYVHGAAENPFTRGATRLIPRRRARRQASNAPS